MNHLTKDIVEIHHSRVLHLLVEKECSSVNEIVRSEATLRSLVRLPHSKVQEIALPNLLFGHRIRMNKQMALILTHVLADISQQPESGAETLLRSFFETDVHLAMGRVSMSRGKTLPEALHSGRRSLEKHSNSLRMPKSDRGPFLVSDCEPAGILLEPLPKLTEDIERKMMALPFKREGEDELALLRLVLRVTSVFICQVRVRPLQTLRLLGHEFFLGTLAANELDLLWSEALRNASATIDFLRRGVRGVGVICLVAR